MTERDDDARFTYGLLFDVVKVLERHGYVQPTDPAVWADTLLAVMHLTETFEGRRPESHGQRRARG